MGPIALLLGFLVGGTYLLFCTVSSIFIIWHVLAVMEVAPSPVLAVQEFFQRANDRPVEPNPDFSDGPRPPADLVGN